VKGGMTIPTPRLLAHQTRRVDRPHKDVERLLSAMRDDGLALHCEYYRKQERWWLSNGTEIDAETAHVVIARADVAGVGDALFGFTPSQTYRHTET
jgi:hypothetical protein